MPTIRCFLIETNGMLRRFLRRYVSDSTCPAEGYHNGMMLLDEVPDTLTDPETGVLHAAPDTWPHDDPRWPTICACGYAFQDADVWQLFVDRVYQRADTGETMLLRDAPVGAIWRAPWYEDRMKWVGPDGKSYVCKTPGGEWTIDGPSTNGNGWTRTGEAPNFTVTPSIGKTNADGSWRYHGWLRDGHLVDA